MLLSVYAHKQKIFTFQIHPAKANWNPKVIAEPYFGKDVTHSFITNRFGRCWAGELPQTGERTSFQHKLVT